MIMYSLKVFVLTLALSKKCRCVKGRRCYLDMDFKCAQKVMYNANKKNVMLMIGTVEITRYETEN